MARPNLRPRFNPPKAYFPILALPTELRLQIHNYLLSVPTSYRYMHADPPRRRRRRSRYPLRRHGMLLVNRQLHAEYAQAFYERTRFIFSIDASCTRPATTLFGTLPPALLPNLRQCKLDVNLWPLAPMPGPLTEPFIAQIEALLGRMERVQRVGLIWGFGDMLNLSTGEWDEWLWEQVGERFVQHLKGNAGMREMMVTYGNRIVRLKRKGAEWVEMGVVPY